MIRLLLVVLVLALLLSAVSRMQGVGEKETPPSPEETIIGSQLAPYNKAEQFSEDYEKELEMQRKELDERIDGG